MDQNSDRNTAGSEIVPASQPDTVYFHGDGASDVIGKVVAALWEAVHQLTRLRATNKSIYYVTIFGSARIQPGTDAYKRVADLAENLTRMGNGKIGIISGGGPGLMQAANEGVSRVHGKSAEHSIGLRVYLPFESEVNPFVATFYEHKDFFSRLHQFVILSDAYIVVEGGVGSLLELALVWQLLQVRKLYNTPFILLAPMWKALVEWARKWMINDAQTHLASPKDMQIPLTPDTADEAIEIVRKDLQRWLQHQAELEALRCPRPEQ
jgi:predicted Rossmann-fold nucleotide-binding protein